MAKVGIDLGTANSSAVVVFDIDEKNPAIVEPLEGAYSQGKLFPSYVQFDGQGRIATAGLQALWSFRRGQSELVVRHFKRIIGRPYDFVIKRINEGDRSFDEFKGRISRADDGYVLVDIGGHHIHVTQIAAHLLRKMYTDTEQLVQRQGEQIESITITLPAVSDDLQRQQTIEAARKAGISANVNVIEEPTAAAIAKGLTGNTGNVMVVDVGAGTTDVIIGHAEETTEGIAWITAGRAGNNETGGIDMDNLILEYVKRVDTGNPKLSDIFDKLDVGSKNILMGAIEDAKIATSRGLPTKGGVSARLGAYNKNLNVPFDQNILSEIVAPIIEGEIRMVVNTALVKAAGGHHTSVPTVIQELEHVVLIGGPCRMKPMLLMLKDVLKASDRLVKEIGALDTEDTFFMNGVAIGAALSHGSSITSVLTTVPHTLDLFSSTGRTLLIAEGTPYTRGRGLTAKVTCPP
jgi:molecular chaperone DnaK (HSP70)